MKKVTNLPKVGETLDGCMITHVINTTAIPRIYLRPLSTFPSYKFHVEIHKQENFKARLFPPEYWAVIVSKNGKTVLTGETRKRKSGLIKTINKLFPNVKIVDKSTTVSEKIKHKL